MSQDRVGRSVFAGLITVLLCNVAIIAGLWLLGWLANAAGIYTIRTLALYALFLIGVTQLLYAVPMCIKLRRRGHLEETKGVVIGMVVTALLNGSCFILLFWMLSSAYG